MLIVLHEKATAPTIRTGIGRDTELLRKCNVR